MSIGGGVWRALERGASIGCEVVQMFVKNNMQWFGKPCLAEDLALFQNELAKKQVRSVFGHTSYLINLGAPAGLIRENSMKSLLQEIEFAAALKLPFLVMHPGAHVGYGEKEGLRRIAAALDVVFRASKKSGVRIALENTAGQGSCLGYRIEHLAAIYDAVDCPERLAVCIDTCHLFAAGFDIRTAKGWNAAIEQIDSLIGLKQIAAFHLNDSKTPLGSRVDRHAHIGKGQIGLTGFRHIVNDPRFRELPGCLETPKEKDLREDVENLATLRGLVRRRDAADAGSPAYRTKVSGATLARPVRLRSIRTLSKSRRGAVTGNSGLLSAKNR
jgi:deoxyribonuclease-4